MKNSVHDKLDPYVIETAQLLSGITYTYYNGGLQTAALIEAIFSGTLKATGLLQTINIKPAQTSVGYSLSYDGFLRVLSDGLYTFKLESADGSILIINDKVIIDNDEPHDIRAVERMLELKAGYYKVKVLYTSFRQNGELKVSWSGPGFEMREIDENSLLYKA